MSRQQLVIMHKPDGLKVKNDADDNVQSEIGSLLVKLKLKSTCKNELQSRKPREQISRH